MTAFWEDCNTMFSPRLKNKEWETSQSNYKNIVWKYLLECWDAVHSPLVLWELWFWLTALGRADVAIDRVFLQILSFVARLQWIIVNLRGFMAAAMASGSNTSEQSILNSFTKEENPYSVCWQWVTNGGDWTMPVVFV